MIREVGTVNFLSVPSVIDNFRSPSTTTQYCALEVNTIMVGWPYLRLEHKYILCAVVVQNAMSRWKYMFLANQRGTAEIFPSIVHCAMKVRHIRKLFPVCHNISENYPRCCTRRCVNGNQFDACCSIVINHDLSWRVERKLKLGNYAAYTFILRYIRMTTLASPLTCTPRMVAISANVTCNDVGNPIAVKWLLPGKNE
jgi:hypothetical protein